MNPKELANLFARKSEKKAAETAQEAAKLEAQKAAMQKRSEEGRTALKDVVIPFFKELATTFPKGQFLFDPSAMMDLESRTPVAVSFKIGDGAKHYIEVINGNVRIWGEGPQFPAQKAGRRKGPKGRKLPAPGFNIQFVYSGNAEPFIAGPSDLTREKLEKLVEMVIIKEP